MLTFANPILPGSYPDPSICRVGADFYLVTSTFEWFPGLPVFHSRDLVHWRQLGHVLDRPEQLPLDGIRASGGLYAPTIRHHDGVFYVVCTLVDGTAQSGNFLVTATDPAGPWSQPYWLGEEDSFDPSLLFDDDGRVWFHAARPIDSAGHTEVWLRELDLEARKLAGTEYVIWRGALLGARWAEGPHLYRIGGFYYLLASEGGTFLEHAVSVARAREITGPYEGNPRNPVLTHRHLGAAHPIGSTGHPDLVQTPRGDWWAVLLAVRPGHNLGRETFLTPVAWEDGWPVMTGVQQIETRPELPEHRWPARPGFDTFEDAELGPQWNLLRTPRERFWETGSGLVLRLRPEPLTERGTPSLVARRLRHAHFAAFAALDFRPAAPNECAGLVLMQNDEHQIRFEISPGVARLIRGDEQLAEAAVESGLIRLAVEAHGQTYQFRLNGTDAGPPLDGSLLDHEQAGSFTGPYLGLYATSNGLPSTTTATFRHFDYRELC